MKKSFNYFKLLNLINIFTFYIIFEDKYEILSIQPHVMHLFFQYFDILV